VSLFSVFQDGYATAAMRRPQVLSSLRPALIWLDRRPELAEGFAALRRALPGDHRFGDSLSTAGTVPAQVAGRWTSRLRGGRLGLVGEVGLAALQIADWLSRSSTDDLERPAVTILFADLVGYSPWALRAGDETALRLLRRVDTRLTHEVGAREGQVVKRLGDGLMAVFLDPPDAVAAGLAMARATPTLRADGYVPRLRVGVHHGRPLALGGDFLGVDVTVAARLCAAADPGQVLLSDTVKPHLERTVERTPRRLPGVPARLEVFSAG
jgi:class 3 adenylate cyclase